MKKLFGLLLFCVMSQAFAAGTNTVRVYDASNMVVTGYTDKSFILGSDTPAGDAQVETAPAKVYIPIARVVGAFDNKTYFSLYRTEGVTSLFGIASTSSAQYIAFPLSVTTGATANYVYAAVKSGTKYYAIARYATSMLNVTNEAISFPVSPYLICDKIIAAGGTECNSLGLTSTVEVNPAPQILVYFFQAPTTTTITVPGGEILPGDAAYNGGIYFEVRMSNRVYETSELTVSLTDVKIGDGRLNLFVSSSADMADFKKMLIFDHGNAASAGAHEPIGNYTGSFIDLNITNQNGTVTVNKVSDGSQLQNDHDYWFSPVLIDKFKFATTLPAPIMGRAQEIEPLLKKQACYLLTAGFGEEHYIIEYFRNFRDHVLVNSWAGRKFINFYYQTAPKYALIIYRSDMLRSVIRGLAYLLYFIFNYIELLSISFASIMAFIIFKRVKKWQHQKKISPF